MEIRIIQKVCLAVVLAVMAGMASAVPIDPIVRTYTASSGCGEPLCGTSGGEVTFTDLGNNKLQIDIDNTSVSYIDGTNINSAIINGIVFDILADITTMTVDSFVDGALADLTSEWTVDLNVDNNITPGNTVVDLSFTSNNGINGGLYNAADPGNTNQAFPDVATLVLSISDPSPWVLADNGISNDILRLQRVGANGGSLKIPGEPCCDGPSGDDDDDGPSEVPEPGILTLLGVGLAGIGVFRRRQKS